VAIINGIAVDFDLLPFGIGIVALISWVLGSILRFQIFILCVAVITNL